MTYWIGKCIEAQRSSTKLMSAFQHIESTRSRIDDSGIIQKHAYEELQNSLVKSRLYPHDDFERVLKEHQKNNDSLPSLEEFEELYRKMKVQLEEEVAERTLALKKTRQKMNKKNQQLVESRHKYEDRLRQQQQALQQAREEIERLNGQLQVERRSKQELEENLDQKRQQKLSIDLFIQAQRAECKVCLVEEVQVLFLPCRHLVTCEKCANRLGQCPLCRENIQDTIRVFWA
ncbi:uncharacterized protein LOC111106726 isoform X2 [Crassostrea virginica]